MDHGRDVITSTPRRIGIAISGRRRVSVALDGEKLKMRLPLKIELAEDQLHVILPPKKLREMGKAAKG